MWIAQEQNGNSLVLVRHIIVLTICIANLALIFCKLVLSDGTVDADDCVLHSKLHC